jgi:outer membrane protein assembly factor BamB
MLVLAVVASAIAQQDPQATITGLVFADRDGDGTRDRGEPPLKSVEVSDGKTVVATDKDGRYEIATDPQRRITDLVWVTVPDGYAAPVDEAMAPQFFQRLEGLADGETRAADFALRPSISKHGRHFTFALLADVHVEPDPTYKNNGERFAAQLSQINELSEAPAFVMIAGDELVDATPDEFEEYRRATATSRVPVYATVGNHDLSPGPDYRTRVENFRRHLGPEWYSFDAGGTHFVVLENSSGSPNADQLEWLAQDLERNARPREDEPGKRGRDHRDGRREVVVVTHIPLNAPETPAAGIEPYVDLLERYAVKAVLTGHTHVNDVTDDVLPGARNVSTTPAGSSANDMAPPGFRQVRFRGDDVEVPFRMFNVRQQLTFVNPGPDATVAPGRHDLQLNAYDSSSAVTRLEVRVDGGRWQRLRQTGAFTWVDRGWQTARLSLGRHVIEARARDDRGRRWSRTSTFTVGTSGAADAPQQGSPWPQFHGNASHTGEALDALGPELRLAWSARNRGSILTSSPAIQDGAVYVGVRDEDGLTDSGVIAVDLASGERLWRVRTAAQVQATPAVEDGIVYAGSARGTLYALDARSGRELWSRTVGVDPDGVRRGRTYFPATVAAGVVFQGYSTRAGSRLMAVRGTTGEVVWDVALENDQFIAATPIVVGDRLFVVAGAGYLHARDVETGALLWRKRPTAFNWAHSVPAYSRGRIFVGFRQGILVALDAEDGDTLWTYQSPDSTRYDVRYVTEQITASGPAVARGSVYMGFPDGSVQAFRAATGGRRWTHQTAGGVMSSPAVAGDTVYVGSNDGHLLSLDAASGERRWGYDLGTWVASSPAVSGNAVVVGAFDGNLYAFTGTRREPAAAGVEVDGADAATLVGGRRGAVRVVLYNARDSDAEATAEVLAPDGWSTEPVTARLAPQTATTLELPVTPPALEPPGSRRLAVDVAGGDAPVHGLPLEATIPVVPAGDRVPLALDAGGPTSPLLGTYTALTPASVWADGRAFGWVPPAPGFRERASGRDALVRDFALSRAPATSVLRVAVPAGPHRVYVLTGDADFESGMTTVLESGHELASSGNQIIPQGQYRWMSFGIDGGPSGRLADLELRGSLRDGYWRLNALVMMPEAGEVSPPA